MFKRNKKDKDSLDKKEKKEKNEAAEQEKKRLERFLGGRRGTGTSPAWSPASSSASTPTSTSATARVTAISSPAASSTATATRKPSFSAIPTTSSSGTIRTAAGASAAAGGASPSGQAAAAAGHTWTSSAQVAPPKLGGFGNSSPDRSSGGDQAPVPIRPRVNPMGTTAHATPSPHGSIPVPPRPTGTGGAGQILSAAYSTRSNVPVLRVPAAATPAVASAGRPLSTVSAPVAAVAEPTTASVQQTQQAAAGEEAAPAGRERSSSSGNVWQQPRSATVSQPSAPSSLATASPTRGLAPPEADGRNRAASISASFVPGVAPSGAAQTRENRRKSLLAPMKPEQVKAALSKDEFSYFDDDEKAKLQGERSRVAAAAAQPASKSNAKPEPAQMSPMSARRAALAAARVERNKKVLGARALGQAPTLSGSQAALHRTTSRTGMRDVAFDTRPAKEWRGATRQGTGTIRLNLAALRSQSFRDPSGFATLKRRGATSFIANPEAARTEEKESNPEDFMLSIKQEPDLKSPKRSERLTRTVSLRATDLFKLEKQANVIVAAMKKRQLEKKEEEERQVKEEKDRKAQEPAKDTPQPEAAKEPQVSIPTPPPAPAPPPPPAVPAKDEKITMLAQGEDYEELFGIALARLEQVKGLYRWRIENMQPVLIRNDDPEHAPHMFYKRDCYLVLNVTSDEKVDQAGKTNADPKKEISSASINFALHYWIGSEASVDKTGSVCFRAVQLNSMLSGRAKHAHEAQGEESPEFLSYYQNYIQAAKTTGLVYLEGGTDTAFKKAPQVGVAYDIPHLYRFYFKYGARCIQRVHLEQEKLDYNEVYLLDTGGMQLYQFYGEKASSRLQYECNDLANMISTQDRKSKAAIEIITQGPGGECDRSSAFWSYFPPKKPFVTKNEKDRLFARHQALFELLRKLEQKVDALDRKHKGDDYADKMKQQMDAIKSKDAKKEITEWVVNEDETENVRDDCMEILCLAGDIGSMNVVSKWKQSPTTPKPTRSLLSDPERVYIFDCISCMDNSEIFVYSGSKSPPLAQQIGRHLAENMLTDTDPSAVKRPAWATVQEIKERSEPMLFKARFDGWAEDDQPKGKSKNACKKAVVDFRGAHEKILDAIRDRSKKGGEDRAVLPNLDVATLFPSKESVEAKAETSKDLQSTSTPAALPEEIIAVEVGILTGGKTFIKINEGEQGLFFSAECYFILETYKQIRPRSPLDCEPVKPQWRVYFWEGKDASSLRFPMFVLGLQPLLEEKIMRSGSPKPEVQRIYQGKEPLTFMKIFDRMISISKGLRKESLDRAQEERLKGKVLMYDCLHSAVDDTMRMLEVPATESSLDSQHSFLVHSFQPKSGADSASGPPELEKKLFVWHGRQSPATTRQALMEYVNVLSHTESGTDNDLEILVAEEGGEDAEFWMALGCEDVPESRKNHNGAAATPESAARLCRFYFEGPQFKAAEVNDFSQKDLASGCAYLLDSNKPEDKLYLWMGNDMGETLRVGARHVTSQYASFLLSRESLKRREAAEKGSEDQAAKKPALKKREIVEVKEGEEPTEFTSNFKDWTRAVFVDPYEVRMRERAERERQEMLERLAREKQEREEKARLEREREERHARGEFSDDENDAASSETSSDAINKPDEVTTSTASAEILPPAIDTEPTESIQPPRTEESSETETPNTSSAAEPKRDAEESSTEPLHKADEVSEPQPDVSTSEQSAELADPRRSEPHQEAAQAESHEDLTQVEEPQPEAEPAETEQTQPEQHVTENDVPELEEQEPADPDHQSEELSNQAVDEHNPLLEHDLTPAEEADTDESNATTMD